MPQTRLPSEVTGTVWKIEVREGDAVTEEQTLLVLESMKMAFWQSSFHMTNYKSFPTIGLFGI